MSRVQFEDYFDEPNGLDICDPFRQLTEDLDDMNIPDNLSLENPGLMSSEFFDSVLSLEEQTSSFDYGINSGNISSSNVDSDFGINSDPEELRLNYNASPDSASSSMSYETSDDTTINNNNVEIDESINKILMNKPLQKTVNVIGPSLQVPGKIIVNNPNGKKVIVTKPYAKNNRRSMANAKHIYKVQSISGNGRTLLLPFNVTKMKNIKIVNGNELCAENIQLSKSSTLPVLKCEDNYSISSPGSVDDDSDSITTKSSRQYPVLLLTEEEKRLLSKEGIRLPTHYPLTKNEEKELKRIRRKIRNKISAQDSRKRKKEYVDGLEERLKQSAEDKKILMNRVKALQQQNSRLVAQMQKLQSLVFNTNKVTPTTCLLIVLMSALLVSLPNLSISKGKSVKNEQQVIARRTLLSSQPVSNDDAGCLDEFLSFNADQKATMPAFEELEVIEDHDAVEYIPYEDCERTSKKSFLDTNNILRDMRNTVNKMKDFFKNQFDLGNDYNEGRVLEKNEPPRNFQKRIRLCPEAYEDYIPTKLSRRDDYDTEEYAGRELNPAPGSPSSVTIRLLERE